MDKHTDKSGEENQRLKSEVARLQKDLELKNSQSETLSKAVKDGRPLLWRGCSRMPCGFVRPHVALHGSTVYVGGGSTGKLETSRVVYRYNTIDDAWSSLPIAPYYTFALAVIKDRVTVIGGMAVITNMVTNALSNFDEKTRKWCHEFPAMLTRRCAASAVANDNHLIVIGGISENDRTYLDVVEILDLATMKWARACPVPKPVTFMSITMCTNTNRIYLLGGISEEGSIRSVFSCVVSDLVGSIQQCQNTQEVTVWEEITQSPYHRSGCATINGKLVIASGLTEKRETSTTIHCFSPDLRKWVELGEMPAARTSCSLAVIGNAQILVVGGYYDPRNWISSVTSDIMATVNLKVPL